MSKNPFILPCSEIPVVALEMLEARLAALQPEFERVAAAFAADAAAPGEMLLLVVLADDRSGSLEVLGAPLGTSYPSLTLQCPQMHLFEREIYEEHGSTPLGHPWLKPVRRTAGGVPEQFFRVEGDEVHEVAVGPVHAGVIEPGHFRFQCHGEEVLHLEIALGYQHRGVERALKGGPHLRSLYQMETVAGDTTIGHGWAYCSLLEALSGCVVPERAEGVRLLALELERAANHTGDLGALAGDVAYLPTASYCGRIRGDFLNMSAQLCGSRLGRGLLVPGGVRFDLDPERIGRLQQALERAAKDLRAPITNLFESPSVMARFEATGEVSRADCAALGLVGPAARAAGLRRDVRGDHPFGRYRDYQFTSVIGRTGAVSDRAAVRWAELQESLRLCREILGALPEGECRVACSALRPRMFSCALIEGWRGEICHCCITDAEGRIAAYKIVDPSFHNWSGLALALRGRQISDFPLCNKSFNLSYAGFDR